MQEKNLPELKPGERLLLQSLRLTLSVREPERFPFIALLVNTTNENNWRIGLVFAYLRVRFPDLPVKTAFWLGRSLGKNGNMAMAVLEHMPLEEAEWCELAKKLLPSDFPIRERVFLAWLNGNMPLLLLHDRPSFIEAVQARPVFRDSDMLSAAWRRTWRRRS